MPKVTIEFNLPDENEDYEITHNASLMNGVLFEFSQDLRQWLKHGHEFKSADEALEKISEKFWEHVSDAKLDIL